MNRNVSIDQMLPLDFGPAKDPTPKTRGPRRVPAHASRDMPMFMTSEDLFDPSKVDHMDLHEQPDGTYEPTEHLAENKLDESLDPHYDWDGREDENESSLMEDIEKNGLREPIEMFFPTDEWVEGNISGERPALSNGHHRAAVLRDIGRRRGQPVWTTPEWHRDPMDFLDDDEPESNYW